MVYLEPEHLGWKVLVTTWEEKMEGKIVQPYLKQITDMLIPVFDKLLSVIRKQLKMVI
jgi:hypothetical protein